MKDSKNIGPVAKFEGFGFSSFYQFPLFQDALEMDQDWMN